MTLTHPGFADPVLESQAAFRALLDAMARPGTIHTIAAPAAPPPPLHRATAAALLTLVDTDTPLFLAPGAMDAADWVSFHTGAPLVEASQARFGLALGDVTLADFTLGSDEAPEDGATLIIQVSALGSGRAYRLEGPGLAAPTRFAADGLGADFVAQWAANRPRLPLGVDVILCAGDHLAAFPRTVSIREA